MAANEVSAQEVAACLEKILETGIRPPGLLDLSFLALKSPEPALRKLAAQQIGRLVAVSAISIYPLSLVIIVQIPASTAQYTVGFP